LNVERESAWPNRWIVRADKSTSPQAIASYATLPHDIDSTADGVVRIGEIAAKFGSA